MSDYARIHRLLEKEGALLLVPDLVEAIAGERVRGSWWSHPKGKVIFQVASRLEDAGDVLTAKLIDGKVTFLHARLWPAFLRVVTDKAWRRPRIAKLDPEAKALLTRVERTNRVEGEAASRARKSLEASLLVHSRQEHTASGRHTTVLESWRTAKVSGALPRASVERIEIAEALEELRCHGLTI